jgi:hypothetical protein
VTDQLDLDSQPGCDCLILTASWAVTACHSRVSISESVRSRRVTDLPRLDHLPAPSLPWPAPSLPCSGHIPVHSEYKTIISNLKL